MLIKITDVKKIIHACNLAVKPEALETLSRQVEYLVRIACSRAKEDHRKRIDGQDFIVQAIIDIKTKRGIIS